LRDAGPGLYTVLATGAHGVQRHLHLRRQRGENGTWGINPELDSWSSSGLVARWAPGSLAQDLVGSRGSRPIDRSLVGLGFVLFLSGMLVDCTRRNKVGLREVLRRWRSRAAAHLG
jgi:hypothetical protein